MIFAMCNIVFLEERRIYVNIKNETETGGCGTATVCQERIRKHDDERYRHVFGQGTHTSKARKMYITP